MDQLLQGPIRYGTGRAAQIPGREVAGKTGTTENFGDAWFVGFTPQLVTAVWVGYPDELRPMLTEYHGDPVAGGTYPALIWKEFTEKALLATHAKTEYFPPSPSLYESPTYVTLRGGKLERDNGVCRDTFRLVFFSGQEPPMADCLPNEVQVPDVHGSTLSAARERLAAEPLAALVVYRPARAGERPGVVVSQDPRVGTRLSAGNRITLVAVKAQHGVVPRVVGLPVDTAKERLDRLRVEVDTEGADAGRVIAQWPRPGVAAAPGMRVVLNVRTDG
jgi:membrane peptidoglycan carboxypeptidase